MLITVDRWHMFLMKALMISKPGRQDDMFAYYANKGCDVKKLGDYTDGANTI